jgi:hypothetical protein
MNFEYLYCHSCGYEAFEGFAAFSRQVANGRLYYCPHCKAETSNVESEE